MFVKRFVSPTLAQGMADVKRQLGVDAVILSANKVRAPGWRGILGATVYEVVAAADETARKAPPSRPLRTTSSTVTTPGGLKRPQGSPDSSRDRAHHSRVPTPRAGDEMVGGAVTKGEGESAQSMPPGFQRPGGATGGAPTTADLLRELQQVRELLGGVLTRGITV
ncbi:MAG: hypothetical protein OWT27_02025, partial [Firmicutes bacterium]|nr:hypothetical protein [Bacillota bacterium]